MNPHSLWSIRIPLPGALDRSAIPTSITFLWDERTSKLFSTPFSDRKCLLRTLQYSLHKFRSSEIGLMSQLRIIYIYLCPNIWYKYILFLKKAYQHFKKEKLHSWNRGTKNSEHVFSQSRLDTQTRKYYMTRQQCEKFTRELYFSEWDVLFLKKSIVVEYSNAKYKIAGSLK